MRKGFSIIEIVVAVALFGMLTLAFMYFMDPLSLLVKARNTRRQFHLQTLMNAIRENIADGRSGTIACTAGDIPTSSKKMASGGASGTYDIAPCLVPGYLSALPFDPTAPGARYIDAADYDTGYYILKNASQTVVLSAPSAEKNLVIQVSFSVFATTTVDLAITGVATTNISSTAAAVFWTTSIPATSQVDYGTTMAYGQSSAVNTSTVTGHFVNLTGLAASTTYHYRVKSRDVAGNLMVSQNFSFTTSQ